MPVPVAVTRMRVPAEWSIDFSTEKLAAKKNHCTSSCPRNHCHCMCGLCSADMNVCTYVYVCICAVHVCIYVCVMHMCMNIYIYISCTVCALVYTCLYSHMFICIYVCTCVYKVHLYHSSHFIFYSPRLLGASHPLSAQTYYTDILYQRIIHHVVVTEFLHLAYYLVGLCVCVRVCVCVCVCKCECMV